MKFILLATLVAGAFCADVVTLTESNFDAKLKNEDIALVEFFAPWCGHCKSLAPEFEKAAGILGRADPKVTLAAVDATEEKALGSKYGVSGYPTLKIFRNGVESADYSGPRDADGIVKYMQKQAGPSSKVLDNEAALTAFLSDTEYSVVGVFSSKDSAMARAFTKAADANRENFRFAHTTDAAAVSTYGEDVVVVFQPKKINSKMEDKYAIFSGKAKASAIKEHIVSTIVGKVGILTQDDRQFFMQSKPLLVVYYDLDLALNPSRAKYVRNRVLKVVNGLTTELTFAVASKSAFAQDVEAFGLSEFDVGVGIFGADGGKYRLDEEWSMDSLKSFVADFEAGKVEKHVKSQENPEADGDVVVATGKTVDDIINKPDTDVFIEVYAPWCGHCKNLAPTWRDLAAKFADEESVTIAKIDATSNDLPASLPAKGYPSIFWVPAGSKKPEKYSGGRDMKDLVAHIKSKATHLSKSVKDEL
eukprot:m.49191 g.49191  ORF g.49191 m.49191 type:complete len:475 (+) comp13348_c0_seq1:76-1500(+)